MNSYDLQSFANNLSIVNYIKDPDSLELFKRNKINGKSVFYWLNVTIPDNILSNEVNTHILKEFKERIPTDNLIYMVLNMEKVLARLNTSVLKHAYVPLSLEKMKMSDANSIKLIMLNDKICDIDVEDNEYTPIENIEDIIPITKPKYAIQLGSILKMNIIDVYYPDDNYKYPIHRCLVYNLFSQLGINMTQPNNPEARMCIKFVDSIKTKVDFNLFNNINVNVIRIDSTDTNTLIYIKLRNTYKKIQENIESYDTLMDAFEDRVIKNLSDRFSVDIDNMYGIDTENTCPPVRHCDANQIEGKVIEEVIKLYPLIQKNQPYDLTKLAICPLHAAYIIQTFPFYKNHIFNISSNMVVTSTRLSFNTTTNSKKTPCLDKMARAINFNNDYRTFKQTIAIFDIDETELELYFDILYNNTSFSSSIIVAQALNFHLGCNFRAEDMYILFSRLDRRSQSQLDTDSDGLTMKETIDMYINSLPDLSVEIDYSTIISTLSDLSNVPSFDEKVSIASTRNFNCIPLLELYKKKSELRGNILLLLLYSSAPVYFKRLIYTQLEPTFDNFHIQTLNESFIPHKITNTAYLDTLRESINTGGCIPILDYYKVTNDKSYLKVLYDVHS